MGQGSTPAVSDCSAEAGKRSLTLQGQQLWFVLVLVLALWSGPWIYLASLGPLPASGHDRQAVPRNDEQSPRPTVTAAGRLQVTDIVISPPLEYVQLLADARVAESWYFRQTTAERLGEFLRQLPLNELSRRQILAEAKWDEASNGFVIAPPNDLIWGLSPQARGPLYHALSQDPINLVQSNAFRFFGTREQWLAEADLEPGTLELIDRLLYSHGGSVFLADVDALLSRLKPAEQTRLLKAISGQRTMIVRLRVTEKDNLTELADYWGRGRRGKDIRPILESLSKVSGGGTIDVAHLLPQFARMRIYTYATPCYPDEPAIRQNCHWTAMNFFSKEPDDRMSDVKHALAEIRANYHPIFRNPKLGDVVIFSDETGAVFHSAVYVADDLLFTKNGSNFSLPWMFMRLDQMKEFYPRTTSVQVSYYRHRSM